MANYGLVLQHHGIKGQRYGIRRAEWYPIEKYEAHLRNSGYDEKTIAKKMKKAQKGEIKYKKQVAKQRYKSLAKAQAAKKAKADANKFNSNSKTTDDPNSKSGRYPLLSKDQKDGHAKATVNVDYLVKEGNIELANKYKHLMSDEDYKKVKDAYDKKTKEEVIKTGDLKRANENKYEYTNDEINAILERNQTLKKLKVSEINEQSAAKKAKIDKMISKMDTFGKAAGSLSTALDKSTDVYNYIAGIANMLGDKEVLKKIK